MSIVFLALGILLCLLPFIAGGIYIIHNDGLEMFIWVFGMTFAVCAVVGLGTYLLMLGMGVWQ